MTEVPAATLIRERIRTARENLGEAARIAPNSYGVGYDTGYAEGLKTALEIIERGVSGQPEADR